MFEKFRRFLAFFMHPNHKLQTRLQLIKRLLNLPNCEQIIKYIFQNDNQQTTQIQIQKLKIYLNFIIEQNQYSYDDLSLTSSDKEILDHLNELLINTNNVFDTTQLNIKSYLSFKKVLKQTNTQNTDDLLIKFDKDYDDELLKIYSKANSLLKTFLKQFEALNRTLVDYIRLLNENSFLVYAKVRKYYLQSIRTKRIKSYDIKQKWLLLIEHMTHENCLWFNEAFAPQFYVLDQTEGPNRERRRLIKSNLCIEKKFFKKEFYSKLDNESNPKKFDYLLCDEDNLSSTSSCNQNNYSFGDSVSYYLRNSENIQ